MTNPIKSISFLYKGERLVLRPRLRGTFHVPGPSTNSSRHKTEYKSLTAKEVVEHSIIKDCDPFLTLETGEKIRVYQGGDSSYLPALIEGLLNKHDLREKKHRAFKELGANLYTLSDSSEQEQQYEFPWEDPYDDRD